MCEYCTTERERKALKDEQGIYADITDDSLYLQYYTKAYMRDDGYVDISFCPMCGRDLKEPGGINMNNKIDRHSEYCEFLKAVYHTKFEAYGDSFGQTFKEFGIISAVVRMADKWGRIKALTNGARNGVVDESLKDTFLDMANYCIMTVMEIEEQEEAEKPCQW